MFNYSYLVTTIFLFTTIFDINLFLIEEPELTLNPKLQKEIPKFFHNITNDFKKAGIEVQFLISTHSPFIVSAAAEFKDSQKVYLIEDGECLNPQGSKKGGAKRLGMEMLGAGVDDILPKTIVICESEVNQYAQDKPNYQKDAFIYQKLYGNLHDVGFYSAGSNEAVFQNNQNINDLIQLIFNGQKSKTEIIGFVDSDCSVKVKKNKYKDKDLRNTGSFNNIESFLFHLDVLERLDPSLPKYNYSQSDNHAENWFNENFEKLKEIEIVKSKVNLNEDNRNFWQVDFEKYVLTDIILEMGKEELDLSVEERKNIYWQLHNCIFN
jgi:hypothetical protein